MTPNCIKVLFVWCFTNGEHHMCDSVKQHNKKSWYYCAHDCIRIALKCFACLKCFVNELRPPPTHMSPSINSKILTSYIITLLYSLFLSVHIFLFNSRSGRKSARAAGGLETPPQPPFQKKLRRSPLLASQTGYACIKEKKRLFGEVLYWKALLKALRNVLSDVGFSSVLKH